MTDKATFQFITDHKHDDTRKLALQAKRYRDVDMNFALRQISGLQIAREKIPSWYKNNSVIYPVHLSMEQSSSEKTAMYKASLCEGSTLVDLTGGLGVDFSFMSQKFEHAIYVEKQPGLVDLANHNFKALGLDNISVINDDTESFLEKMELVDFIYIDPARRSSSGRKTVLIEDCTPNIIELENIIGQKCDTAIIKLSPMLDISRALTSLNDVSEVHIVSVANECKELLFVKNTNKVTETKFCCINITNNKTEKYIFTRSGEESALPFFSPDIKRYLYEPNASVLKAGAYKKIALDFGLAKLHPNSHLYTSEALNENFPGRKFVVKESFTFGKKELKSKLQSIKKANITVRNFPLSVDEIRKKTSIKEGGDIYIFATTLANEEKILIIAEKIQKSV